MEYIGLFAGMYEDENSPASFFRDLPCDVSFDDLHNPWPGC